MLPIILLVTTGILLVLAEVVLPGGIIGVLGFLAMGAATWLSFSRYGTSTGMVVLGLSIASGLLALYLAYKVLPKTQIGKKLYLATNLGKTNPDRDTRDQIGMTGVCESNLRPSGIAVFGSRRMDVVSRGEYIQEGSTVEIVEVSGNRVVVAETTTDP